MRYSFKRTLSLLLCLVLVFQLAEPVFGVWQAEAPTAAQAEAPVVLKDAAGNEVEPDESWEEVYPYGAFGFDVTAADVSEGEDTVVKVYRTGGTKGKATAYITYSPLLVANEDGSTYYGYGLSGEDLTIEVEDPLPITEYQAVGKPADPEPCSEKIEKTADAEGYVLTLDRAAERYQWEILYDGVWCAVGDSDKATLAMDAEYLGEDYDYRCIYTVDGVRYCTDSLKGEIYEKPAPGELPEAPDDIELNPEPAYTTLALDDGEDLYAGWIFGVTFAEGEWQKEIRIHANTDDLSESEEGATIRIAYTDGGEIYPGVDTLLYHVADMNESNPSTVGFSVGAVEADKAEGAVQIPVRREGAVERPVSVAYRTVDGTAKAGADYVAASGTLMLYGNITELPVKVELIDTDGASDEALDFTVELYELKGDDNCTLTGASAAVSLTDSSGEQSAGNLATLLYDGEAVDVTDAVADSPTAANAGSETVVGEQVALEEPEQAKAEIVAEDGAELSTQVYAFPGKAVLNFGTTGKDYWSNSEDYAQMDLFDTSKNLTKVPGGKKLETDIGNRVESGLDYSDHARYPDAKGNYYTTTNSGFAVYGKRDGWIGIDSDHANPLGQKFGHFDAAIKTIYAHDETYDGGAPNYYCSWLVPKLWIFYYEGNATRRIFEEPRDTRRQVDEDGVTVGYFKAAGAANWNVQGKSSGEGTGSYDNPYEKKNYSGDINTTGPVEVRINFPYYGSGEHEKDPLLHNTLLELQKLVFTRRKFQKDAFSIEISTPNDADTSPEGCMKISDYKDYYPDVSIVEKKGGSVDNQVYVGSAIQIKLNKDQPAGFLIPKVEVYYSADTGTEKNWTAFNKFNLSYDSTLESCTVELLGKKGSELSKDEIEKGFFKFRIVYQRDQQIKVDLTPSLPRDDSGNVQTDQVEQLFNNYAPMEVRYIDAGNGAQFLELVPGKPTQDHCFGGASITYGYSTYDAEAKDFDSKIAKVDGIVPQKDEVQIDAASNAASWFLPTSSDAHSDHSVTNIQWVEFGLDKNDRLVFNGRGYPGDARIYFTEADLAGDISIKYYHSAYKNFINAMTTDIAWMRLYLDGNGNGKIDGTYNGSNGAFELNEASGDKFIRNLRTGESFNELEVEPVKLENGQYCQYFIQTCYTMTPRCLEVPSGADKNEKAQVLAAITTSLNQGAPGYSELKREQRKYNYVISGKNKNDKYTSDDHPMYEEIASAKTLLSIPLGGDKDPVRRETVQGELKYVWTPDWYQNNLYSYEHPELIEITNSLAGPTDVTDGAELNDDTEQYDYTDDGLKQMNGYLASMTGASTFVLVSQIQQAGTDAIRREPGKYPVVPDSITMSRVSTTPDASYLSQTDGSGGSEVELPTSGSESEMPEFSMPFDVNLGGNEIGVTDYVTIILDENQVGFAISVPLVGYEKEGTAGGRTDSTGKNPKTANQDVVNSFKNFFKDIDDGNKKLGDDTLGNSLGKDDQGHDKPGVKSGKFSVQLSVCTAFLWQYNPLDNGYYFSAWQIGVQGQLGFRGQIRLTPCPAFYGFLDVKFSIGLKTGLGVLRDTLHDDALLDPNAADERSKAAKKHHYVEAKELHESDYKALSKTEQAKYTRLSSGRYAIKEEALARKDFFLTTEQFNLLSESERADYVAPAQGETYYHNKKYGSEAEAKRAMAADMTYQFELGTKAFDITFKGKLFMEVQQQNSRGEWVKADKESGYVSGIISSDGISDTLVVIRQQDEMELKKPVRIVLRAMDHNEKTGVDETVISYLAPVRDIYNNVHWNGIELSPELNIEIGGGVGVELLKAEIFLHISLGAEFLLWGYNEQYNPSIPEYLDKEKKVPNPLYMDEYYCRVESFNFTIGLAFRIVLICYTYEMDLVSYQINYEANGMSVNDEGDLFRNGKWSYAWHFLNDSVDSIETRDAKDDPYAGVTIRMPQNRFRTQKVYSPEDNEEAELSTQAFDPTDKDVPFQTSGYGSSMDAARLTTDIPDGSQYKVIRTGKKNYIVYTLSRPDETAAPEDSTMLVLSELGYNGNSYGLVNPTGKGDENYIILDMEAVETGDLDFDVWADGSTIRAAWVSYASPASAPDEPPKKPDGDPYSADGKTINADNYYDFASIPDASEWYRYYRTLDSYSAFVQLRAKEAAENTVVKTASWSPDVKSFSAPVEINNNTDYKYVFRPASSGDGAAVFFGSTAQGDDGYKALDAYTEYLDTKTLDRKIKNYLTATKSSTLDVLGTRSALNLAVKKDGGWTVSQQVLPKGQTLANVEFAPARDGAYYVAYTTEQVEYIQNDAGQTVDMVTVYRLYLRRVKQKDGAIVWGNPFLIRELRDFDQNKGGTDGVYSGGSLMEGKDYNAPYLSNLKFLNANLDADILTSSGTGEALSTQAVKEQTLLSFEMDGASYLIPEETLESITGGKNGFIYPFFTPPMHVNQDGSLVQEASSGKLQVDINADDNHNLYAVYIGAVEGTTSNALYLSTYDADVGEWGDGTMLAMHDMNTHEAAVRSDLDLNETELAFLYRSDELSVQEVALAAMYGKEALHTVQEIKAKEDADKDRKGSNLGDGQTFNFASVQTVKGANDGELLAVTQGATRTMSINSYVDEHGDKQFVLGPKYDENGMVSTQGTYVVSFGQGSADLGEGVIYFGQQDFGAGTRLNVTVNAKNVGTTAFRGSDDQPITATLRVSEQILAEWKIRENVISGQGLSLSGECNPLDSTLRSGNTFTLTLSEYVDDSGDSPYNGISKNLDLFTVQDKPDLSVENLSVTPGAITDDGAFTTVDVSFVAANQGAVQAENVFAQFSYVSSFDETGEPVYSPLPLTNSSLKIDAQESLNKLLTTQDTASDAEKGIVYLYSDDGTGTQSDSNIRPGYGKRVSGTIQVPAATFCADESRHAQIKVELFSNASAMTTSDVGAITANHDESYSANNAAEVQLEAFTSFSAAHSIVIPLGTTTKIPISALSTRNTKPALALDEVEDEDGQNIGILNFKQSKAAGGTVSGAISITPIATGGGALHITDTDTATTFSIAFVVTDAENGIDIYRDNEAFTFFNKDGSKYDKNSPNPANQNGGCAEDSSGGEGEAKERPMRDNLATGDADSYFIFDSLAESIDLYFQGKVTVTSSNPAFAKANDGASSVTVTGYGGGIPKTIMLGENPNNDSFQIVVTVNEKRAVFDRLTERYSGNIVPIPEYDGSSPLLIWSRSFPATASVTKGSIPLKLYILDNNGLSNLNINNHIMDPDFDSALTSLDANQLLWCYDFGQIDANETYNITATDISGNITSTTLVVDWFLSTGSDPNNTVSVPPYSARFCKNGLELIGPVESTEGLEIRFWASSNDPNASLKVTGNTFEVYYFDGTGFNKMGSTDAASFPVSKNGIYWARVINPGTVSGTVDDTWVSQVINLTQISDSVLQTALSYNGSLQNPVLRWFAGRDAAGLPPVKTVTINGYSVTDEVGTSIQGQLPIRFNGVYELYAEDDRNPPQTAGQTVTVTDMELTGTERLVSAYVHTKDSGLFGSIEVNAAMLTGGRYDSAGSDPANNSYFGKYKVLMLPPENTDTPDQILAAPASSYDWIPLEKGAYTHAWSDLALGVYRLLFVDCGDGGMTADEGDQPNYLVETVTISDNSQLDDPFRFDDVKDESKFYFDAVYWAYEHQPQITNGMDEIHFEPNTGCTRGQVVTFLWRAAGCPEPENGKTSFTDLKRGGFYVKAVAWAVEKGITNGMTPTTFAPGNTCTRGQVVTFLYRAMNAK